MPHITHHPKTSIHKVTMPEALHTYQCPPCPLSQQYPTPLSSPPQPNNNPTNNKSGSNAPNSLLEKDHRLVNSWINLSINSIIGANQKKSDFWTKVAYVFNQNATNEAVKKASKVLNSC